MRALVAGAGGALGGHLVKRLLADGHDVRAVDVKPALAWWQVHEDSSVWELTDLSDPEAAHAAVGGVDWVFALACNMGGIGYITEKEADCAFSVLITANLLRAAAEEKIERFTYTGSACAYPTFLQEDGPVDLKESDAWPAQPDHGYGLEKLFGEKLCEYSLRDYGLETRVARLHNVYGTHGSWTGGREKAPAAICRKVAEAVLSGKHEIEIWGDGEQTRSFLFVDDFVEGILRIADSDYAGPLNLGSSELYSINELVTLVEGLADVQLDRRYNLTAPQGVRGRNSDNTLILKELGWEPTTRLSEGLAKLYPWVFSEVEKARAAS